jgi:oxalate decarboxylase/phosphoglucose isomerase-like protein (cupin superfamily)
MTNWQDIDLDDPSQWPEGPRVALEPAHVDGRGGIQSLVNFPMKNVSLITSAKGTVRSNHYHLTDWHFMYVLSGSFDYFYRKTGDPGAPHVVRAVAGDLIFTPPMEDHATVFLEDTQLLALSRKPRDQEHYEADVRRITIVDPATLAVVSAKAP